MNFLFVIKENCSGKMAFFQRKVGCKISNKIGSFSRIIAPFFQSGKSPNGEPEKLS
jgi:hypothetical protein